MATVTYHIKRGGERFFAKTYPNFYRRILLLQDAITGYRTAGRAPSLCTASDCFCAYPAPEIIAVTFSRADAERFEEAIAAYALLPFSKKPRRVPAPDFAVELTLDFSYDVIETRQYDFSRAAKTDYAAVFCKEVCDHANLIFRRYFKPTRPPT